MAYASDAGRRTPHAHADRWAEHHRHHFAVGGLNAAPTNPTPGGIALVSQSGAMVSTMVDWAATEGVGFSQLISLGDMADVDVGDCLNWLALDKHTKAILLYLESVPEARKFMSAARAAARVKPVIALKPGRHEAAAKAAMTHTGSLAGSDIVSTCLSARWRYPRQRHRGAVLRRRGHVIFLLSYADESGSSPTGRRGRAAWMIFSSWRRTGADRTGHHRCLNSRCPRHGRTPTRRHHRRRTPKRYKAAVEAVAADPEVDVILAMN